MGLLLFAHKRLKSLTIEDITEPVKVLLYYHSDYFAIYLECFRHSLVRIFESPPLPVYPPISSYIRNRWSWDGRWSED